MTTTTTTTDLTTLTPSEVDTLLAEVFERVQTAKRTLQMWQSDLEHVTTRTRRPPHPSEVESITRRRDDALEALRKVEAEVEPFDLEFKRRGGWTRAWKVMNSNGHIHRTMGCSTCFPTTWFGWLPQVSGLDEATIVDMAGSDACTVCFPSAPVEVLAKPSRLFTKSEVEAQEARDAKAQAKVEREAKRLAKALLPDGSTLRVDTGSTWPERFTTLASARMWLTDAQTWGLNHPSFPPAAVATVAEAVAVKEGKSVNEVLQEAAKRAAKRR